MTDLEISAHEHGVVRVFSVNGDIADKSKWLAEDESAKARVEAALGVGPLGHDYVDVVDTDVLRPLGLSTYLTEGMGLPADVVEADRARLDALSGLVVIVTSGAFGGRDLLLQSGAELSLIGTYHEPSAALSFERITSDSAKGTMTGTPEDTARTAPNRGGMPLIVILAIVIAVALVLLLVF